MIFSLCQRKQLRGGGTVTIDIEKANHQNGNRYLAGSTGSNDPVKLHNRSGNFEDMDGEETSLCRRGGSIPTDRKCYLYIFLINKRLEMFTSESSGCSSTTNI